MSSRRSIRTAGLAAVAALACAGARGASWTGHAVLVGIEDYPGTANDLPYSANGALGIRDALLRDAEHWSASNVTLLMDSNATKGNILSALGDMNAAAAPDDVCVFSFSGHGGLGVYDGLVGRWDLENWLEASICNHVCVIISACNAADYAPLGVARNGFVVLASCDVGELSYDNGWLANCEFGFYLSEALGQAVTDSDGDGFASAEEIFAYVAPALNGWEETQHPQLFDRHVGPLNLVVTGTGTRKGPISPVSLPLGGGIGFGGMSCAAAKRRARTPERPGAASGSGSPAGLLLAGAVLLLCLARKRRGVALRQVVSLCSDHMSVRAGGKAS